MAAATSLQWMGDLPARSRTFSAENTIRGVERSTPRPDNGTDRNPEQLIAAAHASCFSIALSTILSRSGCPSHTVQTQATVTLGSVDGAPTITRIALVTVGQVPGMDELAFAELALAAKIRCSVSRALAGVPEISLRASLI
jgi:osmotically inducible protein OsmC